MARITVSAYVPCYNERTSVVAAVGSVCNQTIPPDEVLVVDDGSADGSDRLSDVKVVRLHANQGRGAVRARAMTAAISEFVLGCDASLVLDRNFLANAMPWFADPSVAAVFGRVKEAGPASATTRWRGRHLYRSDLEQFVSRDISLASGCFVVRKSAVQEVGGFNVKLRHGEDADLGRRLRAAGYAVVFDPALFAFSFSQNTVWQVLERYARWNNAGRMSIRDYLRQINYAVKVMVSADLRARDLKAAGISLLCPHYQFWWRP
jgi:cellulose synthase/poly-beta-1,6-N-acetylglucosamine synthase-like glycosyltransferase